MGLLKGFDRYGGGTTITVGIYQGFGLHKGKWICASVDRSGIKHLIIRDSSENIVFKEVLPTRYDAKGITASGKWEVGKTAAKIAWESAPLGSIEIEGTYGQRVLLYGFKELWKWGVENAGFPPLDN